ncbi:MAG: hypothetical protein DMG86_14425 [Acidobacteria bacterium]|nr:MAG: hypothetical protein DMG86_14425 [Acidobacteriota bacterium]
MLNLEAFLDLCRRGSIERNPAELKNTKDTLRIILRAEGMEMYGNVWYRKEPGPKTKLTGK